MAALSRWMILIRTSPFNARMTEETAQERRRRLARERKQRQRERRQKFQAQEMRLELYEKERELLTSMAEARGFEDVAEYLYYLVKADSELMACNPKLNPAGECVTRHVREFSARCDTPAINGAET